MIIMVHLTETIYEIFSSEGRKSVFPLKKWQKNCRFMDKSMSSVKAPAYRRQAKFKSMKNLKLKEFGFILYSHFGI
jgi:hypothetical protein